MLKFIVEATLIYILLCAITEKEGFCIKINNKPNCLKIGWSNKETTK